jgi:hypothetical protein
MTLDRSFFCSAALLTRDKERLQRSADIKPGQEPWLEFELEINVAY